MERKPWKLPHGRCTMDVTLPSLYHGKYLVEVTPWKLPHGTYSMEVT